MKEREEMEGRKGGGEIKERMVAAGQEKSVLQWKKGLALVHTREKSWPSIPPFLFFLIKFKESKS